MSLGFSSDQVRPAFFLEAAENLSPGERWSATSQEETGGPGITKKALFSPAYQQQEEIERTEQTSLNLFCHQKGPGPGVGLPRASR